MTRRTISVDEDVDRILDGMLNGPGVSGYLSALVRDAERDWLTALDILMDAGWLPAEVHAACQLLSRARYSGTPLVPGTVLGVLCGSVLAMDGPKVAMAEVCAALGVESLRIVELGNRLRFSLNGEEHRTRENRALWVIHREYARGNPRLLKALGSGDAPEASASIQTKPPVKSNLQINSGEAAALIAYASAMAKPNDRDRIRSQLGPDALRVADALDGGEVDEEVQNAANRFRGTARDILGR